MIDACLAPVKPLIMPPQYTVQLVVLAWLKTSSYDKGFCNTANRTHNSIEQLVKN